MVTIEGGYWLGRDGARAWTAAVAFNQGGRQPCVGECRKEGRPFARGQGVRRSTFLIAFGVFVREALSILTFQNPVCRMDPSAIRESLPWGIGGHGVEG